MRKSIRGAIVGAAMLPLAVAGPGMALAGGTGYDESSKKEHSNHEGDKHYHQHHHKHDHGYKKKGLVEGIVDGLVGSGHDDEYKVYG